LHGLRWTENRIAEQQMGAVTPIPGLIGMALPRIEWVGYRCRAEFIRPPTLSSEGMRPGLNGSVTHSSRGRSIEITVMVPGVIVEKFELFLARIL